MGVPSFSQQRTNTTVLLGFVCISQARASSGCFFCLQSPLVPSARRPCTLTCLYLQWKGMRAIKCSTFAQSNFLKASREGTSNSRALSDSTAGRTLTGGGCCSCSPDARELPPFLHTGCSPRLCPAPAAGPLAPPLLTLERSLYIFCHSASKCCCHYLP